MKKFLFLVTLTLMQFIFASCSSDEDGEEQSGNIVGVWKETYYWHNDTHSFRGWQGMGYVHAFKSDGTHIVYANQKRYEMGEIYKQGTYSFDGTYLVVDGGFKRKVTFTENGNGFEWEQTAILEKY